MGDPFKDNGFSVALNPTIKFANSVRITRGRTGEFLLTWRKTGSRGQHGDRGGVPVDLDVFFVHRSFYGMRIEGSSKN